MGLFSRTKPKIKVSTSKKDSFSGWLKCPHCTELVHTKELQENLNCCPKCHYHYRISAPERIAMLADKDSFQELFGNISSADPLNFKDEKSYKDRLESAQKKTDSQEAIIVGVCKLGGIDTALGVLDFNFMAGSMGSAVGEKLTSLIEHACEKRLPLVIISTSGGARMQESIFSLMQMAKTSAALARFHEQNLFYLSVLTNPTSGGVTASFASLGDIIIAEPRALICFAGPRVIEQTIGEKLPSGAQKSEFLLKHGMIDAIVERQDLKEKITSFVQFFSDSCKKQSEESEEQKLPQKLQKLMTLSVD